MSGSDASPPISFSRLLMVLVPIAALAAVGYYVYPSFTESRARDEMQTRVFDRLLGDAQANPAAAIEFVDRDGDLLNDPPPEDQCIAPESLVVSYVATAEPGDAATTWQPVMDALGERLGVPVKYVDYANTDDQLEALATGELHVAGLTTGTVPTAVAQAGFVPVCTFGKDDGTFGYTMKIIVPADSPIKNVEDLRGHKVTFERPNSNSGFKAALVLLMDKHKMLPERDYDWGFSMGHDESIRRVASKDYEAAPVASDLLDRMAAQGEVNLDAIRTVYESEPFPPAAIGYVYNLKPEWRKAIEEVLLAIEWQGTPIAEEYGASGATKFVPVNYKDAWSNIRRVDATVAAARKN
ncbi:MAG: phosphate/phosphite/phosphonate ABC transporter substrate-binding protein [Pirellulales bacterium]